MISLNIILLFFGQMWRPLHTEATTQTPSVKLARVTTHTLVTNENQLGNSTSSFPSLPNSNKTYTTARRDVSPTTYLRNKSADDPNTMAWMFAYLIGGILILMLITIIVIVIWKYVTKRAPVDTHWAGRSPLADGENRTEFPMHKEEPSQAIQCPSIVSITSLPGMYNKKQFLLDDYDIQTNGSKENISVQHNHDAQNQDNQSNPTMGVKNKSIVLAPPPTVPDGFETMNNSIKPPNSRPHSPDTIQDPNLPLSPADQSHHPDPSDMPNVPLPSTESLREAHGNVDASINHMDILKTEKECQRESQLFPPPPPCLLNDEQSEVLPLPPPEVY